MSSDYEQKVADFNQAQSIRRTAQRDYVKACNAFDVSQRQSDLTLVLMTGNRLILAKKNEAEQKGIVDEAEKDLGVSEYEGTDDDYVASGPFATLTFLRSSRYVLFTVLGLIAILAVCSLAGA
jgi:hypothetical protein